MKLLSKYSKVLSILVLAVVIVSSIVVAVNIFNPTEAQACRDQGCNTLFWRQIQNENSGYWVGHNPGDALRTLFSGADRYGLGDTTLHNALWSKWPFFTINPVDFEARLLLKEAVAARLNVSNPGIDYHLSGSQVTIQVNNALASGNPVTMHSLWRSLCAYDNLGCPLSQSLTSN